MQESKIDHKENSFENNCLEGHEFNMKGKTLPCILSITIDLTESATCAVNEVDKGIQINWSENICI
jgi:hypothetical protein